MTEFKCRFDYVCNGDEYNFGYVDVSDGSAQRTIPLFLLCQIYRIVSHKFRNEITEGLKIYMCRCHRHRHTHILDIFLLHIVVVVVVVVAMRSLKT